MRLSLNNSLKKEDLPEEVIDVQSKAKEKGGDDSVSDYRSSAYSGELIGYSALNELFNKIGDEEKATFPY